MRTKLRRKAEIRSNATEFQYTRETPAVTEDWAGSGARESREMMFDAHDRAFAFFKSVCRRGFYDNMKTAIEKIFTSLEGESPNE